MFFLLYRHTDDGVFDDCSKISEDSLKLVQRSHERCRTFSDDFRRLPKTFEEDPKMLRSCTNELKYNLRDSEIIDILTSEDMENMPLESRMWFRVSI